MQHEWKFFWLSHLCCKFRIHPHCVVITVERFPFAAKLWELPMTTCSLSPLQSSYSLFSPIWVTLLRALAFLLCAFLVVTSFCKLPDQTLSPSGPQILSGGVTPPKPLNESTRKNEGNGGNGDPVWQDLLELIPNQAIENAKLVWQYGKDNQLAVVSVGLMTCLTAVFLAGPAR